VTANRRTAITDNGPHRTHTQYRLQLTTADGLSQQPTRTSYTCPSPTYRSACQRVGTARHALDGNHQTDPITDKAALVNLNPAELRIGQKRPQVDVGSKFKIDFSVVLQITTGSSRRVFDHYRCPRILYILVPPHSLTEAAYCGNYTRLDDYRQHGRDLGRPVELTDPRGWLAWPSSQTDRCCRKLDRCHMHRQTTNKTHHRLMITASRPHEILND